MTVKKEITLEDYERLFAIVADLVSNLDLNSLLTRIAQAGRDVTEAEAASILLYDEHARELYFQTATNMDEPTLRGLSVPLDSIAGWVVQHQQPTRVNAVDQDPRYYDDVARKVAYYTRNLLAVPMRTKNRVIGVLEVLNKKQGDFTEKDEHLLLVLAGQAAIAIENTRLFQQFDLISEFVHELRTPLSSLSTATYLLMRPEISPEQRNEIVKNLHKETLRLNELASAFLDLSRLESGRVQFDVQMINLRSLLAEVMALLNERARQVQVSLTLEIPDNFPLVPADANRLKQVFINLISNAIKYNRPGGSVIVRAASDGAQVHVDVEDTGLGIPAEALPHLFEKFYRVQATQHKAEGTGLGLAITRQIVEAHGGRIEVESEPGKGSVFRVWLPLQKNESR